MLSVAVFFLFAASLVALLHARRELGTGIGLYVLCTFGSRVLLHLVVRSTPLFAHGMGGDAYSYEQIAQWIAEQWSIHGVRFMEMHDNLLIGDTSLPPNMFALMIFLNGGETTSLSCTLIVAFAICLTAFNFFALAMDLGATRRVATWMTIATFTSPAVVFYTSDMYKDGLVLMFTLGAVGSALRLSRRFSLLHAGIGALCLGALWFVRYYLVFFSLGPIIVVYMGFGAKGWIRPVLSSLVVLAGFGALLATALGQEVATNVDGTLTNQAAGNAYGGSAVQLDHGLGAVPIRLLYTLFAPFPWTGGTTGLHLGKLDTLFFTALLFRAALAIRKLYRRERSTILGLGAFIVPTTLAYAMTFANMGLMVRQRLPIVVAVALLATLSFPRRVLVQRVAPQKPKPARAGASAGASTPPPSLAVVGAQRKSSVSK